MNIDTHHHFVPDTLLEYIRKNPGATRKTFKRIDGKDCLVYSDNGFVQEIYPIYYENEIRFEQMQRQGIDQAVLAISPAHFNYELEPTVAAETSELINDWIGKLQQKDTRFRGMMTLPMQAPELALKELKRAYTAYGLSGLEIASTVGRRTPDDEAFMPIFAYCAEHGITVCLHPYYPDVDSMYAKHYLTNLVRFMQQTALGLGSLILGGVFERLPDLRVLAYHGGGYFPYQFGRIRHGYAVRREASADLHSDPNDSLKNIWFDTIVHSQASLQFLADTFGADHVVIGTDSPYDMGTDEPVKEVSALRLNAAERDAICFGNARKLFFPE